MPKIVEFRNDRAGGVRAWDSVWDANDLALITKYKWHGKKREAAKCHIIKVEVAVNQLQTIIVFLKKNL